MSIKPIQVPVIPNVKKDAPQCLRANYPGNAASYGTNFWPYCPHPPNVQKTIDQAWEMYENDRFAPLHLINNENYKGCFGGKSGLLEIYPVITGFAILIGGNLIGLEGGIAKVASFVGGYAYGSVLNKDFTAKTASEIIGPSLGIMGSSVIFPDDKTMMIALAVGGYFVAPFIKPFLAIGGALFGFGLNIMNKLVGGLEGIFCSIGNSVQSECKKAGRMLWTPATFAAKVVQEKGKGLSQYQQKALFNAILTTYPTNVGRRVSGNTWDWNLQNRTCGSVDQEMTKGNYAAYNKIIEQIKTLPQPGPSQCEANKNLPVFWGTWLQSDADQTKCNLRSGDIKNMISLNPPYTETPFKQAPCVIEFEAINAAKSPLERFQARDKIDVAGCENPKTCGAIYLGGTAEQALRSLIFDQEDCAGTRITDIPKLNAYKSKLAQAWLSGNTQYAKNALTWFNTLSANSKKVYNNCADKQICTV